MNAYGGESERFPGSVGIPAWLAARQACPRRIRRIAEPRQRLTVAPGWSVNKLAVMNAVERERHHTWQGLALGVRLLDLEAPVSWPA